MILVVLPAHLRNLARVDDALTLELAVMATQRSVLDAVEASYPMLCGTIGDRVTGRHEGGDQHRALLDAEPPLRGEERERHAHEP